MTKIEISLKTLLIIAALILLYKFILRIEFVLILVILAYIIMAGLDPIINYLYKRGVKRGVSIVSIYFLFVLVLLGFVTFVLIPLVRESFELIRQLPFLFTSVTKNNSIIRSLLVHVDTQSIYNNIQDASKSASKNLFQGSNGLNTLYRTALNTTRIIAASLSVIVMSLYMLIDKERNMKGIQEIFPEKNRKRITRVMEEVELRLGQWLEAQFILSFVVFLLNYVALTLLHIKFALIISLIAGGLEVVPVAGPVIAAVIAFTIALLVNPANAFYVLGASIIIHQLENHLLVPKIMQKVIGLSPIITIIALLIGAELMGVIGAVLSVPIATILQIIYFEWQKND